MFSFTKKQDILCLGDLSIGGQPGYLPTVLIGGLFFSGKPDFSLAEREIQSMYSVSDYTGNPAIVDFFIRKRKYIHDILNFISLNIPEHYPFSVDVTDPDVKIQLLSSLDDFGLLERTIYNSIHIGITDAEIDALKNHTPKAVFLVAFNPKDTSPDGKIEVLETGAHVTKHGLFSIAKGCNIKNVLIDTAALAPGYNSGASVAALPVMKEEYGLPVGCAIHNVVEKSGWLNHFSDNREVVDAASNASISLFGGDFVIFGSLKLVKKVFPVVAWQDILVSEYVEQYFGVKPADSHPRRKLFS